MKLCDLQTIYDERADWFNVWFEKYKNRVTHFRKLIENNIKWSDEDLFWLILAQDNNVANNGQWGTIYNTDKNPEFDKIKAKWESDLLPIIREIVKDNDITKDQFQKFRDIFISCCTKNKILAANRVLAAFLPNVLTTTVNESDFYYVEDHLRKIFSDYTPPVQRTWSENNKYFIEYCNKKIQFEHPWMSSIFNWILRVYFKHEEKLNLKKQKQMETYTNLLEYNHNLILTGAPGTGKTYLAKQIAQQMIFGKVKEQMNMEEEKQFNEQCGFVQFHPSYDYTDFVEGLRPIQDDNGNVGFERKDGVFKEFCAKAIAEKANEGNKFDEVWDKFITDIRNNLSNETLTKIGSWEYGLSTKDSLKYSSINTPSQYSFTITKKNIWDTYCGRQARPSGAFQKDMLDIVQYLKQTYDLSDNPELTENDDKTAKSYVFIIDEINRGEISKIFGELFFSIDPGYRGAKDKVQTQYQNLVEDGDVFKNGFYVPENVYIIGTMNDIDRSVESMDFAFRRRFAFKEVTAKESQKMIESDEAWKKGNKKSKPSDEIIKKIKNRMENLNNAIWQEPTNGESDKEKSLGLSSAYHIGASYFLKLSNYKNENDEYTDQSFKDLWDYHLEGLLREYLRGEQNVETKIQTLYKAYQNDNSIKNNENDSSSDN